MAKRVSRDGLEVLDINPRDVHRTVQFAYRIGFEDVDCASAVMSYKNPDTRQPYTREEAEVILAEIGVNPLCSEWYLGDRECLCEAGEEAKQKRLENQRIWDEWRQKLFLREDSIRDLAHQKWFDATGGTNVSDEESLAFWLAAEREYDEGIG